MMKSLEVGYWVDEEPYELSDAFPAAQVFTSFVSSLLFTEIIILTVVRNITLNSENKMCSGPVQTPSFSCA